MTQTPVSRPVCARCRGYVYIDIDGPVCLCCGRYAGVLHEPLDIPTRPASSRHEPVPGGYGPGRRS